MVKWELWLVCGGVGFVNGVVEHLETLTHRRPRFFRGHRARLRCLSNRRSQRPSRSRCRVHVVRCIRVSVRARFVRVGPIVRPVGRSVLISVVRLAIFTVAIAIVMVMIAIFVPPPVSILVAVVTLIFAVVLTIIQIFGLVKGPDQLGWVGGGQWSGGEGRGEVLWAGWGWIDCGGRQANSPTRSLTCRVLPYLGAQVLGRRREAEEPALRLRHNHVKTVGPFGDAELWVRHLHTQHAR